MMETEVTNTINSTNTFTSFFISFHHAKGAIHLSDIKGEGGISFVCLINSVSVAGIHSFCL